MIETDVAPRERRAAVTVAGGITIQGLVRKVRESDECEKMDKRP